jgi:hypothetical protein
LSSKSCYGGRTLRNFLAHAYFRERAAALMTGDGRSARITELNRAVDFFHDVDAALDPLTTEILETLGVSNHLPEAMDRARQADFGAPLPGT